MIALPQDLSEQDRRAIAELINQFVREKTDPERHLTAGKTPGTRWLLA